MINGKNFRKTVLTFPIIEKSGNGNLFPVKR